MKTQATADDQQSRSESHGSTTSRRRWGTSSSSVTAFQEWVRALDSLRQASLALATAVADVDRTWRRSADTRAAHAKATREGLQAIADAVERGMAQVEAENQRQGERAQALLAQIQARGSRTIQGLGELLEAWRAFDAETRDQVSELGLRLQALGEAETRDAQEASQAAVRLLEHSRAAADAIQAILRSTQRMASAWNAEHRINEGRTRTGTRRQAARLVNQAIAAYRAGAMESALRLLERAQALDPNNVAAYVNRGIVLWAMGRTQEAASIAEEALALAPEMPAALNLRALVLIAQGQPQQAVSLLTQCVEQDPDEPEYRLNLGWACYQAGQVDEALAHWQAVLSRDPENPLAQALLDTYA